MMKKHSNSRQLGFTIVELMLAVAVAAILIAVAAPSFRTTIESNTMLGITDDLATSLRFAREEALRQGKPVSMCASSDQSTCVGNWNEGWIIFVDEESDGAFNNDDSLLSVKQDVPTNYIVSLDGESADVLRFDRQGFATAKGSFEVCGPSGKNENARGVIIHKSGGARHASDSDADAVRENHSGVNFSC